MSHLINISSDKRSVSHAYRKLLLTGLEPVTHMDNLCIFVALTNSATSAWIFVIVATPKKVLCVEHIYFARPENEQQS